MDSDRVQTTSAGGRVLCILSGYLTRTGHPLPELAPRAHTNSDLSPAPIVQARIGSREAASGVEIVSGVNYGEAYVDRVWESLKTLNENRKLSDRIKNREAGEQLSMDYLLLPSRDDDRQTTR